MVVQAGTGLYNVGAANTNRIKRFSVESSVANAFLFLRGNNAFYPFVGQNNAPTANQKIAQARVDAIVRRLTLYAPLVGLSIVNGAQTASMLHIWFETSESNVYPAATDIADTLGMADRAVKTKAGLQTMATYVVANATLDGGATFLFAINPSLSDGTASTAPAIAGLTVAAL